MGDLIAQCGFRLRAWDDVTESTTPSTPPPPHAVQRIVMGDERSASIAASARKNLDEGRVVTVHGVFTKV